jgi:flavodoxin
VTKAVGKEIARVAGADFYESHLRRIHIRRSELDEQKQPQHVGDEGSCRKTGDQRNGSGHGSYDTVIVGYPIWWGVAPRIIESFLESYDLGGKTVMPFCTSGGSGVGRSDRELHKNVSGDVKWAKGVQINRPNEKEIRKWLDKAL